MIKKNKKKTFFQIFLNISKRNRRAVYRDRRRYEPQTRKQTRDASPEFYRANPACTHRLIPWLKRELIALFGIQELNQVQNMQSTIIQGILKNIFSDFEKKIIFERIFGKFS